MARYFKVNWQEGWIEIFKTLICLPRFNRKLTDQCKKINIVLNNLNLAKELLKEQNTDNPNVHRISDQKLIDDLDLIITNSISKSPHALTTSFRTFQNQSFREDWSSQDSYITHT